MKISIKILIDSYFKCAFTETSFAKYIFLYYRQNVAKLSKEEKIGIIKKFGGIEVFVIKYLIIILQSVKESQLSFDEKNEIIQSMAYQRIISTPTLNELFMAVKNDSFIITPYLETINYKKIKYKQYNQNADDKKLDKVFLEKLFYGINSPSDMVDIYMHSDLRTNISIEVFLEFIYAKINCDNSIIRRLFLHYPIQSKVKKITNSSIYVFPRNLLVSNKDAQIWVNGCYNQIVSDDFFKMPQKGEIIYATIHSYSKFNNCVKFYRPGYTPEDTINYHKKYNDLLEKMKGNGNYHD